MLAQERLKELLSYCVYSGHKWNELLSEAKKGTEHIAIINMIKRIFR